MKHDEAEMMILMPSVYADARASFDTLHYLMTDVSSQVDLYEKILDLTVQNYLVAVQVARVVECYTYLDGPWTIYPIFVNLKSRTFRSKCVDQYLA